MTSPSSEEPRPEWARSHDVSFSNPCALVERIENDPAAFHTGRRNDDIVNWFFATLLCYPGRDLQFYQDKYAELHERLDYGQQSDLASWESNPHRKVERLWWAYGKLSDPRAIMNLWIPVDYADDVHENQARLPL